MKSQSLQWIAEASLMATLRWHLRQKQRFMRWRPASIVEGSRDIAASLSPFVSVSLRRFVLVPTVSIINTIPGPAY